MAHLTWLPLWPLARELVEAADERCLSRIVPRYGRLDLLCLDQLGYVARDAWRPSHLSGVVEAIAGWLQGSGDGMSAGWP